MGNCHRNLSPQEKKKKLSSQSSVKYVIVIKPTTTYLVKMSTKGSRNCFCFIYFSFFLFFFCTTLSPLLIGLLMHPNWGNKHSLAIIRGTYGLQVHFLVWLQPISSAYILLFTWGLWNVIIPCDQIFLAFMQGCLSLAFNHFLSKQG